MMVKLILGMEGQLMLFLKAAITLMILINFQKLLYMLIYQRKLSL